MYCVGLLILYCFMYSNITRLFEKLILTSY